MKNKKMRQQILTRIEDLNEIAKEISEIKNVGAVYLFGSHATGKSHVLSDIDICVIGNLNEDEKHEARQASSDNLDISFFEDLPIWIRMRIFKEGKPLVMKDENYVNVLKIKTLKSYLDFKPIINRYCEEVLGCRI